MTHSAIASCATFLFLPHFDVICDLLLNRRTATWNLFVKYTVELVRFSHLKRLLLLTDAASYLDDNVVDDIPQDILQRRVPLSQDNEDLVVRGNAVALYMYAYFRILDIGFN